jgi:spore maturation protein CgeB
LHVFPDDHLAQVDAVRSLGIRTVIWFVDDPYFTEETVRIAPHYDVIFTHELSTVQLYRTMGCEATQYLPLGVDTSRFKSMRVGDEYRSDVCFIGQAFWNRVAMIDAIAEYLSGLRVFIAGGLWDRLKHYRMLEPVIRHGWLPVEESIKYYNGAKIVINLHRTTEAFSDNRNALALPGRSINPRTFEICACGTLQLTDVRDDLSAYYRSGFELETFTSPEELSSKIHHYLNDEEARKRIAVRGLYRTLRAHSYRSRIHTLLQLLGY